MNNLLRPLAQTTAVLLLALIATPCLANDTDEFNPPPENFTGIWKVNRPNGDKLSEVSYLNGERHGLTKAWHAN
jgi:hypothetical protein